MTERRNASGIVSRFVTLHTLICITYGAYHPICDMNTVRAPVSANREGRLMWTRSTHSVRHEECRSNGTGAPVRELHSPALKHAKQSVTHC
jgi:hypothetical protein